MLKSTELDLTIRVIETIVLVREIQVSVAGQDESDALDRAWKKAENGEFDNELYYETPAVLGSDREYEVE